MLRTAIARSILLTVLLSQTGCCNWVFTQQIDVTNDPRYQIGFWKGETFRLKTEAYLMEHVPGMGDKKPVKLIWAVESYEKWMRPPTSGFARLDQQETGITRRLATLPAGTFIRVERLEYAHSERPFRDFSLLDPGPASYELQEVMAFSTVFAGEQRITDVVAPGTFKPGAMHVNHTLICFPDTELLSR
jgi:hypothetical protein